MSPLDQWDTGVNVALFGVLPQLLLGFAVGRPWAACLPVAVAAIVSVANAPTCEDSSDGCGPVLGVLWVFFVPAAVALVLLGWWLRTLARRASGPR
jgi:hypothetical protein